MPGTVAGAWWTGMAWLLSLMPVWWVTRQQIVRKTVRNVNVEFDTKCVGQWCACSQWRRENWGAFWRAGRRRNILKAKKEGQCKSLLLSYRARENPRNQFSLCSCILGRKGVFTLPKLLPIAAISFHRHQDSSPENAIPHAPCHSKEIQHTF